MQFSFTKLIEYLTFTSKIPETDSTEFNLLSTKVNEIPLNQCDGVLTKKYMARIDQTQVCVNDRSERIANDICRDENGRFIQIAGGKHANRIVGVTSFNTCNSGQPMVYTRISAYFDWIVATVTDFPRPGQ